MNFIYTITIIFAIIFSTAAFTYLVLCDYKQNISNYILLTIILISAFTYILYLGNIVTESYNDTILTKTKIVYFIFIINVYIIYAIQVIYPKWKIKIGLLYFILPIILLFIYNLLSNDNLKITEIILSFKYK